MSSLKTKPNNDSVSEFLSNIFPEIRKKDGQKLVEIFSEDTNELPMLWGPSIVGFGTYTYSYPSGKTMEWFPVGFSPRKQAISIYLMQSLEELASDLNQLGKHKTGKSCIYINKLTDIDEKILRKMIRETHQLLTKNSEIRK
jgi:hypothetical protein